MQSCYFFRNVLLLFLVNFALHRSNGCSEIQQLIHALPYVSLTDTKCLIGNNCSSLQCTSTAEKATFSVGFAVTCDNDPTIEINANIPTSGIISWNATFNDQTEKVIPGYFFPASQNHTIQRQGYLKVSLKKSTERDSFVLLGLTLKGCENIQENQGIDYSCTQKQIINNQQLACGKGKLNNQQKFCSLFRPFECGEKETCSQIDKSNHGECQCFKGYARDEDGTCSKIITHPQVSTASPTKQESNERDVSESTKDPAALAVNIVVPLLVLILVTALLYAAYKHGLIHQCLVTLFGRTTETVLVTDDDDSPLA
ncbi:uncharacterized protein LOC130692000 [Daphnia carinata]|uniref:uncharacterized protein LOC130692000 n=1 Tax=Daphnia carinata TaxID=120202 RepID=UPI00257D8559|nr:uncharacterized protein LOC130692000 [Daphnia carinata]